MTKLLLTVIVGVFLGAFTFELWNQGRTSVFARSKKRTKKVVDEFREAFAEGYADSA